VNEIVRATAPLTTETVTRLMRLVQSVKTRPGLTLVCLLVSDALALTVSGVLAVLLRYMIGGQFEFSTYTQLVPMLFVFIAAFFLVGLYQNTALNPVEELRLSSITVTLVYVFLGVASFLFKSTDLYSRGVFVVAWVFTLFAVPLMRALTRAVFAHRQWWGHPVVILGANATAQTAIEVLRRQVGLGLTPVGVLGSSSQSDLGGVPVIGGFELMEVLAKQLHVRHALIAMPDASRDELLEVIEQASSAFPKVFVLPNLMGVASLWAVARDFGGLLGLEVRQNLLNPSSRVLKRILDVVLVVLSSPFTLTVGACIALAIKLESRGTILYSHARVGLGGREFYALKFRSMIWNSDHLLKQHFEENQAARDEWQLTQKLKFDPRVTKVGRFLRLLSLDELPQLWNVLRGEMSLIGPRPIVKAEISKYEGAFGLYCRVLPGLGGLWQVSGRSNTKYEERIRLDTYYVRNWSVWLDMYLIARTVTSVLKREGAY
jgi:Undecaprenyl-phosphate galactose phosphotransferase WbaP